MHAESQSLVVGIAGGIASGKTTVARELAKLGAVLLDADKIGHEVLDHIPQVQAELRLHFGDSILGKGGLVDRSRLAEKVFSDQEALAALNRIVHPHLLRLLRSRVEQLKQDGDGKIIVIDAALLVEWGADEWLDYLAVVESDRKAQIDRIRARDQLSAAAAAERIDSQVSPADRQRVADEIISNDGDLDQLKASARDLWRRLNSLEEDGS